MPIIVDLVCDLDDVAAQQTPEDVVSSGPPTDEPSIDYRYKTFKRPQVIGVTGVGS